VLELENDDLEAAQVYLQEAVAIADALALPRFRWGVRTNPRRSPSSVSTAQIGRRSESNPDRQVWIVTPRRAGVATSRRASSARCWASSATRSSPRYKLIVGKRINLATLIADARLSWLHALSSAGHCWA
jgi:hypothetical protein